MNNFLNHKKYLFVFAHPDDEIYSCAFIQKLRQEGRSVSSIYVTSGDYQGVEQGPLREAEALESMKTLGVAEEDVHFLRIPERELMGRIKDLPERLDKKMSVISPDCVVTHDFEGGHNGHDAVSFATARATVKGGCNLYVFPAYHDWPERRRWNQFVPGREATDTLVLTEEMKSLKNQIISIHASQAKFFQTVKESSSSSVLMSREVLRAVKEPMDYSVPPMTPLGYEYPGSSIKFEDFKSAINN